ncbi:MAG: amidohydrolase family protein [Hyphomonadaceae bacterium]|nr:amidohydrolase family protein [Hyphomonadaceae bacterium]
MSVSGDTGIVDGQGRYALPGLIDCHVHPFLSETDLSRLAEVPPTLMTARAIGILEGMLMRGFTSVRDAAGADWGIRKAVEDGVVVGPRLYIAGCALSQTGGHGDFRRLTEETSPCSCAHALAFASRIADGVDEVRKAVRDELRKGADQIKIMVSGGISSPHDPLECDQYSPEEIRVIVSEAERRGTYVMAHAYGASAIKTALECGVRSIEHGNLIDADSAKLAADKNAFLVPTLVTYEVLNDTTAQSGWLPGMLQKLQRVREAGLNAIELCQTHGVKLGFGTDLLGDSFEHQSREFTIRAQVQEPRDIIRSATRINAEIIQEQDRLGILKPGALADIILLNQNPFDDVEVFLDPGRHIPFVMKEGTIFKNQISERQ